MPRCRCVQVGNIDTILVEADGPWIGSEARVIAVIVDQLCDLLGIQAVAVGQDGVVVMHDGTNWSRIQVDSPSYLYAVQAWKSGGQSRALAVGQRGAEYRYADGSWTGSSCDRQNRFFSVFD